MSCLYGETTPNWLEKHRWLDDILTNRLQILSQYYASSTDSCDPMLLFANIMAQATVISLFTAMESVMWASNEEKMAVEKYQQRAALAAEELVRLAKALTEFHIFKVRPNYHIPCWYHTFHNSNHTWSCILLCRFHLYSVRSFCTISDRITSPSACCSKSFWRFLDNWKMLTIQNRVIYSCCTVLDKLGNSILGWGRAPNHMQQPNYPSRGIGDSSVEYKPLEDS